MSKSSNSFFARKSFTMACETKMNKTSFKELVKAVRQKYGKPALKKAETGKDELKKILINSMVSKGKNIPVYLWKLDDENIGLFMEGEDIVKLFRAKKEFEDLLIKVNGPYIEATIELQKWKKKMILQNAYRWIFFTGMCCRICLNMLSRGVLVSHIFAIFM